jgi:hypothetical protein
MRGGPLRLSVVCRGERVDGLSAARDALSDAGFFVTDAQLFSDLAACLTFEGPADALDALIRGLDAAGCAPDPSNIAQPAPTEGEVRGTLALTFARGTGNLRHEKPAVPG